MSGCSCQGGRMTVDDDEGTGSFEADREVEAGEPA
jgi:hypothetical protein